MADRRRVLVGGVVIATVIAVGTLAAVSTRQPGVSPAPSAEPSPAASIGQAASGTPRDATSSPTVPLESPAVTPTPIPTADPTPPADAQAEDDRRPRPRLRGVPAARERRPLDRRGPQPGPRRRRRGPGSRRRRGRPSVDILAFVDSERDWLLAHPPAECYADAHDAAIAMLDAYGTAADRFIAWSDAAPGLESLAALALAAQAADVARDALAAFVQALEATTCP